MVFTSGSTVGQVVGSSIDKKTLLDLNEEYADDSAPAEDKKSKAVSVDKYSQAFY